MKISSITVLKPGDVTLKGRDTLKSRNVETILQNLKSTTGDLMIAGDDVKKFERYALQKALQEKGAHVIVQSGVHAQTQKTVMIIHRMSDKEWKDYQSK